MNTHSKEAADREESPENYRNPGNSGTPVDLGPSTRELLNLLSTFETKIAA